MFLALTVRHLGQVIWYIITEFSDVIAKGRFLMRKALLMDSLKHAFMSSALVSEVQ